MALVIEIADAVAAELSGGTFSQPIAPVRRVLPDYELAELEELRVSVVPASLAIEGASRVLSRHDVRIDIGIQKKLGSDLDTEVSQLCQLVEEIGDFLKQRPLQTMANTLWVRSANEPIYAPDHLVQQRTFTSVLSVTYRAMR